MIKELSDILYQNREILYLSILNMVRRVAERRRKEK